MRRIRTALFLLATACGVGDEPLPPAELGAVCGEDGAVRVLELEPGVRLVEEPQALGDRVILHVGTYGPPSASGLPPSAENHALWATGPCGEAPVQLAPVVEDLVKLERWPEVLLGHRRAAGELVTIAADGTEHAAFTGLGTSYLYHSDHGFVTLAARDEDTATVLLHRFPDDPRTGTVTGTVLLEEAQAYEFEGLVFPREFTWQADEVFALTPDDTLMSVSLIDGVATVEQTGVQKFAVSPDGRWLIWQALSSDPEDLTLPGAVSLRDRDEDAELKLGDLYLHATGLPFAAYAGGLVTVALSPYVNGSTRVIRLEDLDFVDLADGREPFHVFADGRWAVGSRLGESIERYDPTDESITRLAAGRDVRWWGDDAYEVLGAPICCLNGAKHTDESPLFRVTVDGEVARLADRVTRVGQRLADGRWVTGLGIDDSSIGELVLIDPDAQTSAQIDDRVFPFTARVWPAFGEDVVTYSVDDGERSGVWIARLPP